MSQPITFDRVIPTFPVTDVAQSAAYYTGKLGFEQSLREGDCYAHMKRGDAVIALYRFPELQERTGCQEFLPPSKTRTTIFIRGIGELYDEYRGKGVHILDPPTEVPYGTDMQILDCNGHVIEFVDFGPDP